MVLYLASQLRFEVNSNQIFSNLTGHRESRIQKVLKRNATTYEKVYLCSKKEVMCTLKQKKNYFICNWSGMNMRNTEDPDHLTKAWPVFILST